MRPSPGRRCARSTRGSRGTATVSVPIRRARPPARSRRRREQLQRHGLRDGGENSYRTLESLVVVLASGTVVDTADPDADRLLAQREPALVDELMRLRERVVSNAASVALIERQFAMKNTMGYALNAFLDFDTPAALLAHLVVGSEGTLAFVAEATFRTVPVRPAIATTLAVFPTLDAATRSLPALVATGAATWSSWMPPRSASASVWRARPRRSTASRPRPRRRCSWSTTRTIRPPCASSPTPGGGASSRSSSCSTRPSSRATPPIAPPRGPSARASTPRSPARGPRAPPPCSKTWSAGRAPSPTRARACRSCSRASTMPTA